MSSRSVIGRLALSAALSACTDFEAPPGGDPCGVGPGCGPGGGGGRAGAAGASGGGGGTAGDPGAAGQGGAGSSAGQGGGGSDAGGSGGGDAGGSPTPAPTLLELGAGHSCLAVAGGEVRCWGYNGQGQLGDGTIKTRSTPAPVELSPGVRLAGVESVALGDQSSCALVSGGKLHCWGHNAAGQLGDGTSIDRSNPVPVEVAPGVPLTGVRAVAMGSSHGCALVDGGELRCWGSNDEGQLGDGTIFGHARPAPVLSAPGVPLGGVRAVAVGGSHTCALIDGGKALCWGENDYGELGDGSGTGDPRSLPVAVKIMPDVPLTGVEALALGAAHSCALVTGGEARCWGFGDLGQLGDGGEFPWRLYPVPVETAPGVPLGDLRALVAGSAHSCALTGGGQVRCWGASTYGQLGTGVLKAHRTRPVAVERAPGAALTGATALAAGSVHTCAVGEGGEVLCWGHNPYGELGDGQSSSDVPLLPPTPLELGPGAPLSGVQALRFDNEHGCALVSGGEAHCWGSNYSGQLGNGTNEQFVNPRPVGAPPGGPLVGVLAVDTGGEHNCALLTSGELWCWGANDFGQLGDGTTFDRLSPAPVELSPGVPLTGVEALALGYSHSCALVTGGGAYCWGYNGLGLLGDGTTTDWHHPTPVLSSPGVPLGDAARLVAGDAHACAVLGDGHARCWGQNDGGQIGDGTTTTALYAVAVKASPGVPLTGLQALTLGSRHGCALLGGGEARCWGQNDGGQIGDGSTTNRSYPTPVRSAAGVPLSGVQAFGLGVAHSCALLGGGDGVRCWGSNFSGQLGDGTTETRLNPVPVVLPPGLPLASVQGVAAGGSSSGVLLSGGGALCWGSNYYGQLGIGRTAFSRPWPAPVLLP